MRTRGDIDPGATAAVAGSDAGRAAGRRRPRAGQLTPGWRLVTGATWVMVFVAFTGVWKASRELGLATWWLGPIGEPRPVFVMLLPFLAPVAMVVADAEQRPPAAVVRAGGQRRAPRRSASAISTASGASAYVELAIAAAAALVSIASFSRCLPCCPPASSRSGGRTARRGR